MLFERIAELSTLEAAWEKVRRNGGGGGGDGVQLSDYADGLALRLIRLQRDLQLGSYMPGPLRELQVRKRSGGFRTLSIPCVNDRVAQTAACLVLGPILDAEMEDSSFGYRPGRSVRQAVARVAAHRRNGYGWVVDGDIERYFDTVPHDRLLTRLRRSIDDRMVETLVRLWLDCYSPDGIGLPQGSPLSPILANLYLDEIDERIAAGGVRLVRFADDFLLMCRSEMAATRARTKMADLLAEHGLRLHPEKTRVVPFEQGFRFLGHLFVRSIVVQEVADEALDPGALAAALPPEADGIAPDALRDSSGQHSPGLRALYVMEPGRRLGTLNDALTVEQDGKPLLAMPVHRVDRIELGPGVEASVMALRQAVSGGAQVAFVNGLGDTVACLDGRPRERAARQLEQARHVIEEPLRLDLARRIVSGRLRNQRSLLRRVNRLRDKPIAEVDAAATGITQLIRRVAVAEDVPTLLGYEGAAAALYWPAWSRLLNHGWSLPARRRRPPPDPVNLALSYLSSMLYRVMAVLVARHGLNPGFGVLHGTQDYEPGCVSDLIEEFRAPLVEALTMSLLNTQAFKPEMVCETEQGCRLLPEGRAVLIRGHEHWLGRTVKSPRTHQTVVWRRLMEEQVMALVDHIEGRVPYEPLVRDH